MEIENNENLLISLNELINTDNISNTYSNDKNKLQIVSIQKLESGLTNKLYIATIEFKKNSNDNTTYVEKVFIKLFGEISKYNLIDRKFETDLINVNSQLGLCARSIKTDYEKYRIEEYLTNIKRPDDDLLFENKWFKDSMLEALINFQMSVFKNKNLFEKYSENLSIFNFLPKVVSIARRKFYEYESQLKIREPITELIVVYKMSKIKHYLDNYDSVITKLTSDIDQKLLILNHNDVHKYNLLIQGQENENKKLLIIDYEYACMNFIGFDIINYCIESFFDLEYLSYPFYRKIKENVNILYEDEKYFNIYLEYLDHLRNSSREYDLNLLKNKNYFIRISGLCSIFWFYCALISLEYDPTKENFNYFEYSLDRLSIYETSLKYQE